jgi:hypothetical protein
MIYSIDMCEMGTPLSSTANQVADLFDNDIDDGWNSDLSGEAVNRREFVGYQWPQRKTVKKIRWRTGEYSDQQVSSVEVQYSNDGTAWYIVPQVFSGLNTAAHVWNEVVITGDYKATHWRLLANSGTGGGHWKIEEVEMQGVLGKFERQTITVTVEGSTESTLLSEAPISFPTGDITTNIGGYNIAPIFDPMNRTLYRTPVQVDELCIYYTFPLPVLLRHVQVNDCYYTGSDGGSSYYGGPKIFLRYRPSVNAEWVSLNYGYGGDNEWRNISYLKGQPTKYWAIVFKAWSPFWGVGPAYYEVKNLRLFSQQVSSSSTIAFL